MADDPDAWTISIEQWPSPACRYEPGRQGPVLRGVNEAFESAFGTAPVDEPLASAVRGLDLSIDAVDEDLESWLSRPDRRAVRATRSTGDPDATTSYLLQAVDRSGDSGGFLVLTRLPATGTGTATADSVNLGHVASVVSHDLRNPLDVARARLRVGREEGDDDHFERVARAHDRMERIVDDVLTLASGLDAIDRAPAVDLESVVDTAWDAVETPDAELVVAGALPTAVADRDRTARLFENLFRNAIDHGAETTEARAEPGPTNGDGPDVTVTVGRLDSHDCGVFVADDGRGIPADRRGRVFDPGYSTDAHGTGLGLAIVERIATLHGWSVEVASSVDGGARFEIRGIEPTGEADSGS